LEAPDVELGSATVVVAFLEADLFLDMAWSKETPLPANGAWPF
jgi:hypothetical protein